MLPFVLVPTVRLGRRIRRTTRSAQDNAAELNQILQETLSGQQVVKSFGAEEIESNRFRAVAAPAEAEQPALRRAAGGGVAADRVLRRHHHRGSVDLCPHADQSQRDDARASSPASSSRC